MMMNDKGRVRLVSALLALALACLLCAAPALGEDQYAPGQWPSQLARVMPKAQLNVYLYNYWRNDIPEGSGGELPVNFRTMTSEFHDYQEFGESAGMEADYQPDLTGLDSLNASGSGFFNEAQFAKLVETIRAEHDGPIYDVDLRREAHGLLNDTSVTWYSKYNLYMIELTDEEADAKAREFMHAAEGTTQVLYNTSDYPDPSKTIPIQVETVTTEDELAAKYDVRYVHIPCTDHIWPSDAQIDTFIELVKGLPEDAWLHVHCSAGKGRTTSFLAMYDMMRNPQVSLKDVACRQAYLGTMYVLSRGNGSAWHSPYDDERADMIPRFYEYVQANQGNGFVKSWSEYRQEAGF